MSARDATRIAEALGVLLQRRFRSGIYEQLTAGLGGGVDAATYPVLSGVARTGPISAAALAEEIGLDRSVVSRRGLRLLDAGLLRSAADPADARAMLLSLTQDGQRVVRALRGRLATAIAEHLRDWTPEERDQFATLLARFCVESGLA